jgi:hypothetical protein
MMPGGTSRASVSAGGNASLVDAAMMTPHSRPPTLTGRLACLDYQRGHVPAAELEPAAEGGAVSSPVLTVGPWPSEHVGSPSRLPWLAVRAHDFLSSKLWPIIHSMKGRGVSRNLRGHLIF